jgi:integrase
MKQNLFPYVKLRPQADGTNRPRFVPGPRERVLGFASADLRHDDGRWFSLDETARFAAARAGEIAEARKSGKRAPASGMPAEPAGKTVAALLDAYFRSADFSRLAPKTRADYALKANALRFRPLSWADKRAGGSLVPELLSMAPAAAVKRTIVKAHFERMEAERGRAMAKGAIAVLSAAYSWGELAVGWELPGNPCLRLKLPSPDARVVIYGEGEISALVATADAMGLASIGDAIMLGLFCGQRQGDILALVDQGGSNRTIAERASEGEALRFVQGKTGARVAVFAAPELVARLADAERRRKARNVTIVGDVAVVLREETGAAWDGDPFRKAFAAVRAEASKSLPTIADKKFLDLRDTAVTWLARAGCTIPEICSMSGHSLQSATTILKHYLELGEPLAREAIRKMVDWMAREGVRL